MLIHSNLTVRTEADAAPPRPGWVKALGIAHLVVGTLLSVSMLGTLIWTLALVSSMAEDGDGPEVMGLASPRFIWFVALDAGSGLIGNALTFASGVGLLNLKLWGARIWRWLAPAKIVRLILIWGGFIIGVAPTIATAMARLAVKTFEQGNVPRGKFPTVSELSLVYAWAFLAMAIGMIVLGSVYPALTWWLSGRPGLRAALVEAERLAQVEAERAAAARIDTSLIKPVAGDPLGEVHPS